MDPKKLVELYARDTELFCYTFFPQTFRLPGPVFQTELFRLLDDPKNRQVGIEVFRGGGKTTILRGFTAKRISFGISRTILFLSASQGHSLKSTRWIRKQIESNRKWTSFWALEPGDKWTDEWLEIRNGILGITVSLIAGGVTGQVRGFNIDDHRPDLIVVDDPDNEESTGTEEQRQKMRELFFGAIAQSLTPAAENPEAKIVLLQTSLHPDDLINTCHRDSSWTTRKYPCFLPSGESAWPAMWRREELEREKQAYADRGQMLIWLREKECHVGREEAAFFREEWLRYWETIPERLVVAIGIDPAPPASEAQLRRGLRRKDSEVITVAGWADGNYYILEQVGALDHDPDWTVSTILSLAGKWKPLKIRVETTAYQQTLKYYLEKEMRERRAYYVVEEFRDQRRKQHRILQAFSGIASNKSLFIHRTMLDFRSQFTAYPNVDHDDYLDSAALALEALEEVVVNIDPYELGPDAHRALPDSWRIAP
jgi:phage terminase large subunit-like protein